MKNNEFYVDIFLAPSATGKTTLEEKILLELKDVYDRIIYYTTRAIRVGETDGVHANFISVKDFNEMKFAATEVINDNWKYGVSEESVHNLKKNVFISIISNAYMEELRNYCIKCKIPVRVFYLKVEKEERIFRMKKRGEKEENIKIRLDREDIVDKDYITRNSIIELDLNKKNPEEVFQIFKTAIGL